MNQVIVISQVILWVAMLGLGLVVLALARQIGLLHERLAPMGALMMDKGPVIGDPAPVLHVEDLAGHPLILGGPHPQGRITLLLFVSPTCPVCKKLLPLAKDFARAERRDLTLILIGDGDRVDQEQMIREHRLQGLTYVVSPAVGMAFQVGKLPYAVLIGSNGTLRAKGLVNSREHLESLMMAYETGFAAIQDYLRVQEGQTVSDSSSQDVAVSVASAEPRQWRNQ